MKKETKENYHSSLTSYNKIFYWYFLVLILVASFVVFFINKTYAAGNNETVISDSEIEEVKSEHESEGNITEKESDKSVETENVAKGLKDVVYITKGAHHEIIVADNSEYEESVEVAENDDEIIRNESMANQSLTENAETNTSNLSNNKKNSENLSYPIEKSTKIVYNYNPVGNSNSKPINDKSNNAEVTTNDKPNKTESEKDFDNNLVKYDVTKAYITIDVLETLDLEDKNTFTNNIKNICEDLELRFYNNTNKSYFVIGNNDIYYIVRYSFYSSVNSGQESPSESVLLEIYSVLDKDIEKLGASINTTESSVKLSDETLFEFEKYKNNNKNMIQSFDGVLNINGESHKIIIENYTLNEFTKNSVFQAFIDLNNKLAGNSNIKFNEDTIEFGNENKVKIKINA